MPDTIAADPTCLSDIRDNALQAFDERWSEANNRPRASFEGVRETFWKAAYTAALDYVVSQRSDLDQLRIERDALEDHVDVFGDCQRQAFLGDCADCDQYHRLGDRIRAIEGRE